MKKGYYIIVMVLLACTFSSCCTTQRYIKDLRALVEEVQQNGDQYTVTDWHQSNNKFYSYVKNYPKYSEKMTHEERHETITLGVTYMKEAAPHCIQSLDNELCKWLDDNKKQINNLFESFKNMMKRDIH